MGRLDKVLGKKVSGARVGGMGRAEGEMKDEDDVDAELSSGSRDRYERRRTELALELFGYGIAWWAVLIGLRLCGLPVSRRLVSHAFRFPAIYLSMSSSLSERQLHFYG